MKRAKKHSETGWALIRRRGSRSKERSFSCLAAVIDDLFSAVHVHVTKWEAEQKKKLGLSDAKIVKVKITKL